AVEAEADRAAPGGGRIVPGTAAHRVRIGLARLVPGVGRKAGLGAGLVVVGVILVEHPLGHVAIHVVQSPRIGLFLADFLILEIAVLLIPRVFAEFAGIG